MLRRNFLKGLVAVATVPAAVYAGKKVDTVIGVYADDSNNIQITFSEPVTGLGEGQGPDGMTYAIDPINPPEGIKIRWNKKAMDKWYDKGWPNV